MHKKTDFGFIAWILCAILPMLVWGKIFFDRPASDPEFYFLDVGQGDATLVVLPQNINILTDAGPDRAILKSIEKAMRKEKYIDLAVITHPELDHFNGFNYILNHDYRIGAFVVTGKEHPNSEEWDALLAKIREKNIPIITVRAGDAIRYRESVIRILSPDQRYIQSAELNDTGIVEFVSVPPVTLLLSADIDAGIEAHLSKTSRLDADILKVPHHGSKFSSSEKFLEAVSPYIAVVEVGGNNRYGHPAPETLERLASSAPLLLRTDKNGTIKIRAEKNTLKIFSEKTAEE